ncbi:DUF3078 domain-containing protein [Penaeicola halotolerans]|uniref:DUF3078 domain-containing protein n=1 Tax=Penaeicola halotolerans TaxID=2793196 RepID=UPI001CF8E472|nr:DUF3078 domain-containing protein [Penaeicola halotolerans]
MYVLAILLLGCSATAFAQVVRQSSRDMLRPSRPLRIEEVILKINRRLDAIKNYQGKVIYDSSFLAPYIPDLDTVKIKERNWKIRGNYSVNMQQVSLVNWAAGGNSSFALNSTINIFLDYKKDENIWNTRLTINGGFNRQSDRDYPLRKTNDAVNFSTKYGRQINQNLYLSSLLELRTQLLPGFRYFTPSGATSESKILASSILAPGYIQSSTGLNYTVNGKFSLIASPFTGRFTVVRLDSLANEGAFGVERGQNLRSEAGASINATTSLKVMENIQWDANINLFSNYETFGNMVVNLESILRMKVNKYISTQIETNLIYDERVLIRQEDGSEKRGLLQVQNLINLGVVLEF